jgi:hypothetical protein
MHELPRSFAALGEAAYCTGRFLSWLVKDKKITPHVPVRAVVDTNVLVSSVLKEKSLPAMAVCLIERRGRC